MLLAAPPSMLPGLRSTAQPSLPPVAIASIHHGCHNITRQHRRPHLVFMRDFFFCLGEGDERERARLRQLRAGRTKVPRLFLAFLANPACRTRGHTAEPNTHGNVGPLSAHMSTKCLYTYLIHTHGTLDEGLCAYVSTHVCTDAYTLARHVGQQSRHSRPRRSGAARGRCGTLSQTSASAQDCLLSAR